MLIKPDVGVTYMTDQAVTLKVRAQVIMQIDLWSWGNWSCTLFK